MKNKTSKQPLCSLHNVNFSIADKNLFDDLTIHFYQGDKIALIGKNGVGKSTLFKIITKHHLPDSGKVFIQPGAKKAFLIQDVFIKYDESQNILDYIIQDQHDKKYLADQFLTALGLDGNRKLANLSGGRLRRVELAKTLFNQPDILLLDEPTNHLDLQAIEWLESYLKKFEGLLIVISHDRQFLENVTNKILFLDRGKYHICYQGFSAYEEFITKIEQSEIENLRKTERKLEQENHWLTYGVTARRKRNQRRLGELHDLRDRFQNEQQRLNNSKSEFNLPEYSNSKTSQCVIQVKNLTCGYNNITPPKIVLKNFSTRILKGERVGIIGRNGAGKTTFIKTLLQAILPVEGEVIHSPNLKFAYMDQKREQLDLNKSVWDNLADLYGEYIEVNNNRLHLSSYLNKFSFKSEQFISPVKILSGGEQNRLLMAIALAKPCELLILDEPTNDLDLESLEILEDYLHSFQGTIIVISHDRQFIDNLVTKIIIIGDNNIEQFVGSYADYLQILNSKQKLQTANKKAELIGNKEKSNNKVKLSFKEQRDLEVLPAQIEKIINQINQLELKINDSLVYNNYQEINKLTDELADLKQNLDENEQRLLELMILAEELNQ